MGKKFLGLGGTDHFWDRAKAWILNQITSAVAAKIAEVVANAPEDLDTLKEIADWISAHADDAAAMNTQITENKNNIAANSSSISAMNTQIQVNAEAIAGKADKVHTHTKSQITDFPTSLPANGGTADKAVGVLDYGDISRTVKIGYYGPGVTADKLLHLAGYTELSDSSVKIKDVTKEEIIKWLGIPRIKYADYQTPTQTFTQFQQVPIELSKFSPEVTPNNVLCFMVIYWSSVQIIASGDWGIAASTGLKCSLIPLGAGTGQCVVRCVYMV